MRTAGYRTGVVGKWDMGQAKRYLPRQRGFDFFYGHGNNGIDYYTHERYGVPSMFRDNARTEADKGTLRDGSLQTRGDPVHARVGRSALLPLSLLQRAARRVESREVGVQAPAEFIAKYPAMDPKAKAHVLLRGGHLHGRRDRRAVEHADAKSVRTRTR